MAISEKSASCQNEYIKESRQEMQHTLSVQEVADSHGVTTASVSVERRFLEHVVGVLLGANAHVLLTKGLNVLANVGALLLGC
jgi:hypothetical protein